MPLTQVQGQMLNGSNNTTTTIQSNGTTAITIDSSQNVGIGTTSPVSYGKLTVSQPTITSASNIREVFISSPVDFVNNTAGCLSGITFRFSQLTYTPQLDRAAGIYGINTDTATGGLYGRSAGLVFYTSSQDATATERMRITSTGQVNLTRPVGDDTQINFLQMQGGGTSGGAVDNLSLLSRYTASVSTSAKPIFGGPPRGSIVVVTGYTGASYFSDILNCSSNTVTVISSQNSTGSPASRTYSIVSFLLNLEMGSGTYDVGVLLLGTQPRY